VQRGQFEGSGGRHHHIIGLTLRVIMATRGSDLSGKCGACRRKVSQGTGYEDCGLWFHWECAGINSVSAILP
jgi:hypothetical protein